MRLFTVGSILILSLASLADNQNPWIKIIETTSEQVRGVRSIMSEEDCEGERLKAKRDGCVTDEQMPYLKKEKACPACDYKGQPLFVLFEGCFAAGTRIYVERVATGESGWEAVEDIVNHPDAYVVWSLTSNSVGSKLFYKKLAITRTLRGPEDLPLVVIEADNGNVLKVTEDHPILLANGSMVKAHTLTIDSELMGNDGKILTLADVRREKTNDLVYNFMTTGKSDEEHVILVEGDFLVGDRKWQNMMPEHDDPIPAIGHQTTLSDGR